VSKQRFFRVQEGTEEYDLIVSVLVEMRLVWGEGWKIGRASCRERV